MKWLPWTIAAICWIGIIVGSMYWFRSAVIGSFDEQAMRDWQADRAKLVEGQRDGTAPVTRRINPNPNGSLSPSPSLSLPRSHDGFETDDTGYNEKVT